MQPLIFGCFCSSRESILTVDFVRSRVCLFSTLLLYGFMTQVSPFSPKIFFSVLSQKHTTLCDDDDAREEKNTHRTPNTLLKSIIIIKTTREH